MQKKSVIMKSGLDAMSLFLLDDLLRIRILPFMEIEIVPCFTEFLRNYLKHFLTLFLCSNTVAGSSITIILTMTLTNLSTKLLTPTIQSSSDNEVIAVPLGMNKALKNEINLDQ